MTGYTDDELRVRSGVDGVADGQQRVEANAVRMANMLESVSKVLASLCPCPCRKGSSAKATEMLAQGTRQAKVLFAFYLCPRRVHRIPTNKIEAVKGVV